MLAIIRLEEEFIIVDGQGYLHAHAYNEGGMWLHKNSHAEAGVVAWSRGSFSHRAAGRFLLMATVARGGCHAAQWCTWMVRARGVCAMLRRAWERPQNASARGCTRARSSHRGRRISAFIDVLYQ